MATRQREKSIKIQENRDKRPTAIARYIRITSGKVEIVLDLIRGKSYEEAVAILQNTAKSASPVILKVLNSAAANAENNLNMAKDLLYVAECYALTGPTMKRMMPRARGRADRILKRTSHIRVILDERTDTKAKPKTAKKGSEMAKITSKTGSAVSKAGTSVAKNGTSGSKSGTAKTSPAKPKPVPSTTAERPLTTEPNAKAPLGAKKANTPAKPATKGGK